MFYLLGELLKYFYCSKQIITTANLGVSLLESSGTYLCEKTNMLNLLSLVSQVTCARGPARFKFLSLVSQFITQSTHQGKIHGTRTKLQKVPKL